MMGSFKINKENFKILDSVYDCKIQTLYQDAKVSKVCLEARTKAISLSRLWYKLKETKNPTDPNPANELLLPQLNQTQRDIGFKAMFDDVESRWFSIYYGYLQALNKTALSLIEANYLKKPMTTYDDFKEIYEIFLKTIQVSE